MDKLELQSKQESLIEKMNQRAVELGYNPDEILPIYDGVKDFEGYLSSNPRILWIMKEPYEEGRPQGGGWPMYDFTLDMPMFRIMAKIVYGIVNKKYFKDIPEPDEDMLKLLQTTAFINVSKMPGATTSNPSELRRKLEDWKDIIRYQVDLYSPNVIIMGNTYNLFDEGFFGEDPRQDSLDDASDYGITAIQKTKDDVVIIDTYHPSPMRKCGCPGLTDEKYINSIIKGVLTALEK